MIFSPSFFMAIIGSFLWAMGYALNFGAPITNILGFILIVISFIILPINFNILPSMKQEKV